MHSILSNKSVPFVLLITFTLFGQIVLGQNEVDLSLKKGKTKKFIELFVSIYGSDLKKIDSNKNQNVLKGTTEKEILESDGKHALSFEVNLENNTHLTFSAPKIDTVVNAYEGNSDNLNRLFKDFNSFIPLPEKRSNEIKNQYLKDPLKVSLFDNPDFIRRYYNRQWREYRRPHRLTFSVFGGVNLSTAFVSPFRYSDETELKTQTRRENEGYLPTGILGASIGYSHYSHGVDAFFQRTNYGCKFIDNNLINWNTGYYGGDSLIPDSTKLSIPVGQWGIRYRYSNYHRKISPYVAVGIHVSFMSIHYKNVLQLNSQYLSTGCNLGLGLNIHPIYALDIHIAPVMNISFNAVKGTELQTRFSSIALEVGVRYNLAMGCSKNKTPKNNESSKTANTVKKGGSKKDNKPKPPSEKPAEKKDKKPKVKPEGQ